MSNPSWKRSRTGSGKTGSQGGSVLENRPPEVLFDMERAIIEVRRARTGDADWLREQLVQRWGGSSIASRGRLHDALELPTWIATHKARRVGFATLRFERSDCELVSLDALVTRIGVGSALLRAAAELVEQRGLERLWLVTTNENHIARAFYLAAGMRHTRTHVGAVALARELKPTIPLTSVSGEPIVDELEFEWKVGEATPFGADWS